MTHIPEQVACTETIERLAAYGLLLAHEGKVRQTYQLPGRVGLLFMLATDRLSIFDLVLPTLVPHKGAVLTGLTVFWLDRILNDHQLIAKGSQIDQYLPTGLRGNSDLQSRGMIIRKLEIIPIECVVRGYLTGSG